MLGLKDPGLPVWLSKSDNPKRKLRYSWELAEIDGHLVGINTAWPNHIVAEALQNKHIEALSAYDDIRPEVKYGENSRVDFLLSGHGLPNCYLEVKNVHLLRKDGCAEFPDSKTARGVKHLRELGNMVAAGQRAINLYLVQRSDCTHFNFATDLDPAYAQAAEEALNAGVEFLCYDCTIDQNQICLRHPLPISPVKR